MSLRNKNLSEKRISATGNYLQDITDISHFSHGLHRRITICITLLLQITLVLIIYTNIYFKVVFLHCSFSAFA